jgi:hypothetical protein
LSCVQRGSVGVSGLSAVMMLWKWALGIGRIRVGISLDRA